MEKKEIYEQVIRLTKELEQTKVAEKIFKEVADENAERANIILSAFPYYYPELYRKIVEFGEKFNNLVGASKVDKVEFKEILRQCELFMYNLAQTGVIKQIAEAENTGDAMKLQKVVADFEKDYSGFVENLLTFQEAYSEYRNTHQRGNKGAIFGRETNEENNVFVFDTNIIDTLSFYLLIIIAKISDQYLFYCDEEIGGGYDFINAIKKATNESFAEFVDSYNIVDWIGVDERYKSIGELLVDAWTDGFEQYE